MAKQSFDLLTEFPGLLIIHQKIPSREVGRHEHGEHEFFLPLQGEITIHAENREVKAGPGRMLYVPPNLDHSFSSTAQGSGERLIWLVDAKLWRRHAEQDFAASAWPTNSLAKELLFYLLLHPNAAGATHFISALMETLVESLQSARRGIASAQAEHLEGKVQDERIRKALRLIDANPAEAAVSGIARESGLSLRNLNRLFLKETGLTPKDYVIGRRMEKAKALLRESRLTVTDIALEVGYGSLSKFIETFKATEGVLPSDYRAAGTSP